MPELPEVETIRRQLEPLLVGRRVERAGSHPSARFVAAGDAVGATATAVDRRGKYLLVGLDDHRELVIHLGMTGVLRPRSPGASPLDPHIRAWWDLDDSSGLELRDPRRFGRVAVVPAGDHTGLATLHRLGPEPLTDGFTAVGLWVALRASSARVKTQLLAQRAVAGVGNIYADEALWQAGIDPRARRVSRAEAATLHEAIRAVLSAAVDHGGTTLRDYRTVAGGPGRNQHHLACYGRAGAPCLRCGAVLVRVVVDGRGTTWCPACQRGGRLQYTAPKPRVRRPRRRPIAS